jgi:hypothetical protein
VDHRLDSEYHRFGWPTLRTVLLVTITLCDLHGGLVLICFITLVFFPYLWYSNNHPDWAMEPLPDWARKQPIALFRAPWYGNWGGSLYAGIFVFAAVPFTAMGRYEATLPEALWIGVQFGVLAAVGFFPLLAWFTFVFPIRVFSSGMRGFDKNGFPVCATWTNMTEAFPNAEAGTEGYEIGVQGRKARLWIPKTVASQNAFQRSVARLAPPDHVVLRLKDSPTSLKGAPRDPRATPSNKR